MKRFYTGISRIYEHRHASGLITWLHSLGLVAWLITAASVANRNRFNVQLIGHQFYL